MKDFHIILPSDAFFQIIITLLYDYDEWREALDNAEDEESKESAISNLSLVGSSVELLLEDLYEDKMFMNSLIEYCNVHDIELDPTALISDIIGERFKEEHQEIH